MDTLEKPSRITSIDLLRGVIMVVMALDHVRDFLHFDAWVHDPLDFRYTTPPLFLTRWITHFCAPNFILLAGLSAYLYEVKKGSKKVTSFLLTRGLWLILLELTLFKFLWTGHMFNMRFTALVIWAIGISMVFLAFWRKLSYWLILVSGLLIVFCHNLTDGYVPDAQGAPTTIWGAIWGFLHVRAPLNLDPFHVFVLYPVLPYFGLIALGYCLGKFYAPGYNAEIRQRNLILIGTACITLFAVLRLFNIYGDSETWASYHYLWSKTANYTFSFLSFINTTKYPCSLLYCLMTIGPALIFLAIAEGLNNPISNFFLVIGRVPMFYYILHLCLIRLIVLFLSLINHFDEPQNHYHLVTVYFAWFFVVFTLYFPCAWFAKYKAAHPEKGWLSYL